MPARYETRVLGRCHAPQDPIRPVYLALVEAGAAGAVTTGA